MASLWAVELLAALVKTLFKAKFYEITFGQSQSITTKTISQSEFEAVTSNRQL